MKAAVICVSTIFALMVVSIGAGLILGFRSGVLSVQGTEVLIQFGGTSLRGFPVGQDEMILHDSYFFVTTSIYVFVTILAVPLVLLATVAAALLGRSARPSESE